MIAMHPAVQRKLVEEVKEAFGDADTSIDYDQLNKLTYMDMVIRETMRLLPVAANSARQPVEEFDVGSYIIPKGATILLPIMKVQRNKKYWGGDADQFRPERFEPESFAKIHPYAFIPFLGGPRICIGWRFAMLFMKSVLANFLMTYEVTTDLKYEEIELELPFLLEIVQGPMISIRERQ